VSLSNHPYRSHTTNGGGKPSNWLWPVCPLNWHGWLALGRWWKSHPKNWKDGGSLTQETIRTLHGHSGQIRKWLENVRQPLHSTGMVVHPILRVGIVSCTLCTESFESLKSFGTGPIVLSSIPIEVLETRLVLWDALRYWSLNYVTHYYMSFL
jgi:hypothetical protein